MPDGSLTTAAVVLNAVFFAFGISIYLALVRQIGQRDLAADGAPSVRTFSWPDACVAFLLACLFALNALAPGSQGEVHLRTNDLIYNGLFSGGLFVFIFLFLKFRGVNVDTLAGFSRFGLSRAVATGVILLLAAYPLVIVADRISQRLLAGDSSKQGIVDLFNGSPGLRERVLVIVLAVTIAPLVEEFVFRFYLYGVLKRYLGCFAGLLANSILFAAVHAHIPSAGPLFVLGACLTLAYEWSGSILVSMTMHALFNSFTLVALAYPEIFPQQ